MFHVKKLWFDIKLTEEEIVDYIMHEAQKCYRDWKCDIYDHFKEHVHYMIGRCEQRFNLNAMRMASQDLSSQRRRTSPSSPEVRSPELQLCKISAEILQQRLSTLGDKRRLSTSLLAVVLMQLRSTGLELDEFANLSWPDLILRLESSPDLDLNLERTAEQYPEEGFIVRYSCLLQPGQDELFRGAQSQFLGWPEAYLCSGIYWFYRNSDFSYLKSVRNATDMASEEKYDYIVIGGGTAGCPLAATLSEKHSVLVLERGGTPGTYPNVLNVAGFFANLMQEDDGQTPAQRFTSKDGVPNVRGRVLGGSSMINAGVYSRADDEFLSNSGVEWDMDSVEKAYQWVEESVVFRPNLAVWQSAVKEALLEAGVGPDNGLSVDHEVGTKIAGSTFDGVGKRYGAVELLNKGDLGNLRVAVHATVETIILSEEGSNMFPFTYLP
ncbi:(R)-mandelonitrile lyase 1 [Morus notabilis]|uniref:(R)-mandelonitrile lyase 1 n=1 Tax=Morus notabilis TaxID=981085 RepID=W9RKJ1_9ROSA|nr:(R)-mandelonitrile lyase 1 [Morus notabilis]